VLFEVLYQGTPSGVPKQPDAVTPLGRYQRLKLWAALGFSPAIEFVETKRL